MLWRTTHGTFLHVGDGPRGWLERIELSEHLELALPARDGAAILAVTPEPTLLGIVPFEGRLRASRFVGGEVLLVNHEGQLFRSTLPAGAPSRRQPLDPEGDRIDERAIQLARLVEDLP